MKIVILDGETIHANDLNWDPLQRFGEVVVYDRSSYEESRQRIAGAEIVIFSKIHMDRALIASDPALRFCGVAATGFDNLDVAAARERGIACTNVPAYATEAVAQHTIALLLELCNHIGLHNDSVHSDEWNEARGFCYWKKPLMLLAGKTIGIVGYGHIGRKVAEIAAALGMTVRVYRREPEAALAADVVSLHIPATPETVNFINAERIEKMKDGALLINTARGTLVDEEAVAAALRSGKLGGFAADVLRREPPSSDDPLIHMEQCVITPHNSWCPPETRRIICDTLADNIESWLAGGSKNRIDL
ncbi:MAG: D-2-hydroxyacid dehydrogenase [Anaerovoracaceae bacterium]